MGALSFETKKTCNCKSRELVKYIIYYIKYSITHKIHTYYKNFIIYFPKKNLFVAKFRYKNLWQPKRNKKYGQETLYDEQIDDTCKLGKVV